MKKLRVFWIVSGVLIFTILMTLLLQLMAISRLEVSMDDPQKILKDASVTLSLRKTSLETKLQVENPTFYPVLVPRCYVEIYYGKRKVAHGRTEDFVATPGSVNEIDLALALDKEEVTASIADAAKNFLTGKEVALTYSLWAEILDYRLPVSINEEI